MQKVTIVLLVLSLIIGKAESSKLPGEILDLESKGDDLMIQMGAVKVVLEKLSE